MVAGPSTRSDKTEEKAALEAAKNNVTDKGRETDRALDTHTTSVRQFFSCTG